MADTPDNDHDALPASNISGLVNLQVAFCYDHVRMHWNTIREANKKTACFVSYLKQIQGEPTACSSNQSFPATPDTASPVSRKRTTISQITRATTAEAWALEDKRKATPVPRLRRATGTSSPVMPRGTSRVRNRSTSATTAPSLDAKTPVILRRSSRLQKIAASRATRELPMGAITSVTQNHSTPPPLRRATATKARRLNDGTPSLPKRSELVSAISGTTTTTPSTVVSQTPSHSTSWALNSSLTPNPTGYLPGTSSGSDSLSNTSSVSFSPSKRIDFEKSFGDKTLYHSGTFTPFLKDHFFEGDPDSKGELDESWKLRIVEEKLNCLETACAKNRVLWTMWNRYAFENQPAPGVYAEIYMRYAVEKFVLEHGTEIHRLKLRTHLPAFINILHVHGCIDSPAIVSIFLCLDGKKRLDDCQVFSRPETDPMVDPNNSMAGPRNKKKKVKRAFIIDQLSPAHRVLCAD